MLCRFGVIFSKVFAFIFVFMWTRWTLPRFRFDQLMGLCWKGLVPVGMLLVMWVGLLVYWGRPISPWATIGDLVIATALIIYVLLRQPRLSGRQPDLPAVGR
jgi:NADH-quinone oxidoreductase subunit H